VTRADPRRVDTAGPVARGLTRAGDQRVRPSSPTRRRRARWPRSRRRWLDRTQGRAPRRPLRACARFGAASSIPAEPVDAEGSRVVAEVSAGRTEEFAGEPTDHLPRMATRRALEELDDREGGGVPLQETVGDHQQAVAWMEIETVGVVTAVAHAERRSRRYVDKGRYTTAQEVGQRGPALTISAVPSSRRTRRMCPVTN
jgi:hypothetical protein